jgi:hypothetical protein
MKRVVNFSFIIALTVVAAILTAATGFTEVETEPIDQLRMNAKELVLQQAGMGWKTWVLGEPSNQAALYGKYPKLFTAESIRVAQKAVKAETDPEQKKALSFFESYLESEYLYKQTAILWDIYNDLEAELKVLVDGKLVPYRDLEKFLSNADSPERRAELATEEYRIYRLLNSVVLKRELEQSHRLAKELGYKDYLDLAVKARNFDLESLLALCEEFLDATEERYLALFDEVSPVPRDKFRRSDILYLLGAKNWDEYFPKDRLVPIAQKSMSALGFDPNKQKNLLMHTEALPKKNPRAVCFPIRVPADVRLSIKPRGGKDDFSSLFHELGHAEHFASAQTPIWEFQQLGSNAVTEGYAYLFEGLVENPDWLSVHTTMKGEEKRKYLRHAAFSNLYMMRRYMSKLIYEVKLHRQEADPQRLYQTLMSRGYGFALNEDESLRYLSDVDALLYSADYVQAFFLQAMLEKKLQDQFGKQWWKSKKAGGFLKSLFAEGNSLSGRELSEKLGYKAVSGEALEEKINSISAN